MFAGAAGKARFGYLLEEQEEDGKSQSSPLLHVYCFSKAADPERDALDVRSSCRICLTGSLSTRLVRFVFVGVLYDSLVV